MKNKLNEFEIKLKKLNEIGCAGAWENSEYYYDETCSCCEYKSIEYANKYNITLDDFNILDDYDGFRFQNTDSSLICEICYKSDFLEKSNSKEREM